MCSLKMFYTGLTFGYIILECCFERRGWFLKKHTDFLGKKPYHPWEQAEKILFSIMEHIFHMRRINGSVPKGNY